ncbi:DnaJ domain-containing protein [Limtongia smithiae]|uniref:DnaJ domain-containing protein n=1 Tax=Limtongia smithiae TaxID=1125753 RepID=UPI0034CF27F9
MAAVLPAPAAERLAQDAFVAHAKLTPFVTRTIEPVGPQYLAHARRALRGRTWSEDERIEAESAVKNVEADVVSEDEEEEDPATLARDPKEWKGQDHYKVLGLSKYRFRATDEQIRRAHRKKVLKHHPDKKAASGGLDDDGFFKCIQKAMEILSDPVKRRQFDSVDEEADVPPPSRKAKGSFYKQWGPVFEAEGRFSRKQPVPKLGDETSTKPEVDGFYGFFYKFDSWRSFEYLDEDAPDDTDNRDHKRHVERKNRAARQRHKTEDTARLRKLVDDCLALDPRIKQFKDAERKAKEQKKWDRDADARKAAEEAKKAKEDAERKAKEEEERAKNDKASSKKAKEAAKNAKKKNRRTVKGAAKEVNYFVPAGTDASAAVISEVLTAVDALAEKVDDEALAEVAGALTASGVDSAAVKAAYAAAAEKLVAGGKAKAEEFAVFSV